MNLYIKKMIAIVLTIALCLSSAACAAEPDGKKSKKHGEKVNEEPVLAPETELPAYSDNFLLVLEHTRLDPAPVDAFFGYAIAAYNTFDAERFCRYAYEELDMEYLISMVDAVSSEATKQENKKSAVGFRAALALRNFNVQLSSANLSYASCNTDYAEMQVDKSKVDYDKLKNTYGFSINQYGKLLYGEELLSN